MRRATIGRWMFAPSVHCSTILRCASPAVDHPARQVDEFPEAVDIIHEFSSPRNRDKELESRVAASIRALFALTRLGFRSIHRASLGDDEKVRGRERDCVLPRFGPSVIAAAGRFAIEADFDTPT